MLHRQVKMWRRAPCERDLRSPGAMQAGGLREGVRVRYVPQFSQDDQNVVTYLSTFCHCYALI